MKARRYTEAIVLALATLLFTQAALACPVCYGPADDPMVKGMNNGIWVLLSIVGFVQIGFVAMFWSFWRRARALKRFRESLHVIEGGLH
jgi:heme/copper-type cytochrome/quinol oxidase subunit 2